MKATLLSMGYTMVVGVFLLSIHMSSVLAIKFDAPSMTSLSPSTTCAFATTTPRMYCGGYISSKSQYNIGSRLRQQSRSMLKVSKAECDINYSIGHVCPFTLTATSSIQPSSTANQYQNKRVSRNPIRWARNASQSILTKVVSKVTSINHKLKQSTQPIKNNTSNSILNKNKHNLFNKQHSFRPTYGLLCAFATLLISSTSKIANASGGIVKRDPDAVLTPLSNNELFAKLAIWLGIFTALALFHAAEIAITTLYPWKVREFAEEEEKQKASSGSKKRGTFQALNEDITRVLTTILVSSTACSIYATTLFTHLADHIFGTYAEKWSAIFLTVITLFFVELLPKNIGVINAERVARLMVPPINMLANVIGPVGFALSALAKGTLRLFGVRTKENSGVTDSELRLIVTGARDSGTIDHSEQEMIKGVLNLQDQKVREIMKPRVEVVAVPKSMSVASVLGVVRESGYSRIPVYDGEIDNIVGIVLAKSVLDFFVKGVLVDGEEYKKPASKSGDDTIVNGDDGAGDNENPIEQPSLTTTQQQAQEDIGKLSFIDPPTGKTMDRYVRSLTGSQLASRMETTIDDAGLIESCYFVPETANGWSVLQEMRRRRVHMAVVVDEYGGTEGLVSLEDIVEEVSWFLCAYDVHMICTLSDTCSFCTSTHIHTIQLIGCW